MRPLSLGERYEQVLGGYVLVGELARFALGRSQHREQLRPRLGNRVGGRARTCDRKLIEGLLDVAAQTVEGDPELGEHAENDSTRGVRAGPAGSTRSKQHRQQVQRRDLGVAPLLGERGGGRQRLL